MMELAASGNLGQAISAFISLSSAGKKLLAGLKSKQSWQVSRMADPDVAAYWVRSNSRTWPAPRTQELAARTNFVSLYASLTEQDRLMFEAAVGTRLPSLVVWEGPQASRTQRAELRRDGTQRAVENTETYRGGRIELHFDD